MSSTVTSNFRRGHDHFEPQDTDPQTQRRLRGQLEQIDYTAFASNTAVIAQVIGKSDSGKFQRLAVAAAVARARWVAEAVTMTEGGAVTTAEQTARLATLRTAYEELAAVYEAMRRMVERGYLTYSTSMVTEGGNVVTRE
ncbi:hypothetical protein ASD21_13740 [Caulobacter sp. Root1455]|uniref:hypothetical protein n=1 Tax=unclassified Caulobacter TaxID=2648921 RepID=UPI0006FB9907|nr:MULTISPECIES: hypothetical protein [unclassified Caulobacter]KQY30159.1 hypothetical protein ASD38_12800 [Caulobacter sp. Root487D2Y]KQY92458.1 hypothetical protein ASD21_13740 [Caulobacter sp. Root1455]